MAVAHTAINKGVKAGVIMSFGAAIIEFFQVWIALKFTWLFAEGGAIGNILQIIAAVVFFVAGIYFLFFGKAKPATLKAKIGVKKRRAFIQGVGISLLNLMVIPYWIFYGTLLTENGLLEKENLCVLLFAAGATAGAFALLVCYSFLGAKILSKSEMMTRWVNGFIGVVLIAFGIYQWFEIVTGQ